MFYVYVLKNENSELYFGCTHDLKKRIQQHNSGKSTHTKLHTWRLIYYEAYLSKKDAFNREKQLKRFGQASYQLKRRIKYSLYQEN